MVFQKEVNLGMLREIVTLIWSRCVAGKVQTPPEQAFSAANSSASGPPRISSSPSSVTSSSRVRTSLLANPFYEDTEFEIF
jgi:hypothetical protein